jgi:BlaI family transcriptional regulator, penicillinase repressor
MVERALEWGLLSKRERQIMEAIFLMRAATVRDVRNGLTKPPSYSAVRTTMNILVRKGFLTSQPQGRKYLYRPVVSPESTRRNAARHLLRIYFEGSVREAVLGLIDADAQRLGEEDYRELIALLRRARSKTRGDGKK